MEEEAVQVQADDVDDDCTGNGGPVEEGLEDGHDCCDQW